ncbi:hypothetical protein ACIQUQ_33190 [Streptomyces sp. NPDC101118]|uniref:hypothetical protein n=1 Tax=Streptomyces sp. NPDC101118 TaxID=3366109 RepID=UPI0038212A10
MNPLRPRRPLVRAAVPALLAVSFGLQVVGALAPDSGLLALATVSGLAAELALHRWQGDVAEVLARLRADVPVRQVLRDFLLVAGLLAAGRGHGSAAALPLVFGLLLSYALHFASRGVAVLVRRSRNLPVLTRNVDTAGLRLPPAPPALLLRRPGPRMLWCGLPSTAGLLVAAGTGVPHFAAAGIAVSLGLAATALLELSLHLLPSRRPAAEAEVLAWFDRWLAEYRPTVGMYFSGGTASAYQADMWLGPLAALGGRPVVVLRERFMLRLLAPTDLPVVCLPKVEHLMRLEHSTLRVLIHPANSGKTSQVLRIPTVKHAFVNHGESDKPSSCNPYAKAYDQVWVAGPAARERYARAEVGVDDRDVVEIGRPQLEPVHPYGGPPAGGRLTVLYAPTWEGWTGDPGGTSLVLAGERLVGELLADPGVRLLYRPHPMTGSVDPRAAAADARIRALVRAAGAAYGGARPPAPGAGAELARRTAVLDALTAAGLPPDADGAERMRLQGAPVADRALAVEEATAAWEAAYWAAHPEGAHQVLTGPRPGLYACFNAADLLVGDVSSVVSDFLASGKPYAVVNTGHLGEADFRAAFPTARAAWVLGPDAAGVAALLESVRDPAKDTLRAARAELREHLLGPDRPSSAVRFRRAALALGEEAERHRERRARRAAVPGPGAGRTPGPVSPSGRT